MHEQRGRPGAGASAGAAVRFAARAVLVVALLPGLAPGGTSAEPDTPAQRIVSLNPSLTAVLVAIGARGQLVGVDDWSRSSQPEVAGLPSAGGLYSPSLEAVVGLRPDLVVLVPSAEQRDFRSRLQELGLPVLELDPVSFEDVLGSIEELGRRSGHAAEAAARVSAIRATRARVERWAAGRDPVATVLVLQRDPLFLVGRGSFIDDMLGMAGARNLAADLGEAYPRASREWLIDAAPEVLLDSSTEAGALDYWQRWPSLPAVAAGRVRSLPDGVATLPGPHLDRSLLVLVEALHGEVALQAVSPGAAPAPPAVAR